MNLWDWLNSSIPQLRGRVVLLAKIKERGSRASKYIYGEIRRTIYLTRFYVPDSCGFTLVGILFSPFFLTLERDNESEDMLEVWCLIIEKVSRTLQSKKKNRN